MKKTLVTLAALAASVASAGDGVADYSVNNPTGTIQQTISDTSGAFTMIAILDWDVLMSDAISEAWDNRTDILTTYNTSAWGNASWKQGVTLFRGDSATTLKLGIHKDYTDQAITGGDGYNLTLTEAGYGIDGKLALAYTFSGGVVTVAALQNDGTTWTTGSFDTTWSPSAMEFIEIGADGVIDSLVTFDEALTGDALTYAYKTYTIPEPATATLSLLALAGLAARRRRK